MKRRTALPIALVALGTGAVVFLATVKGSGQERVEATRALAARFLDTEPESLALRHGPRRVGAGLHRVAYTSVGWEGMDANTKEADPRKMRAEVSIEHGMVFSATWPSLSPAQAPDGRTPDVEEAVERGRAFLTERCSVFTDENTLTQTMEYGSDGCHAIGMMWRGPGPGDNEHWIDLRVSAIEYAPVSYVLYLMQPDPPASRPINVTREEAYQTAAREVPKAYEDAKFVVMPVSTATGFAPRGEPVYRVSILVGELGAELWGIHATTGEVIKERNHLPPLE